MCWNQMALDQASVCRNLSILYSALATLFQASNRQQPSTDSAPQRQQTLSYRSLHACHPRTKRQPKRNTARSDRADIWSFHPAARRRQQSSHLCEIRSHTEVPLLHHPVVPRGQEALPVRRDRQPSDEALVAHRPPHAAAAGQVPQSNLPVTRTCVHNKSKMKKKMRLVRVCVDLSGVVWACNTPSVDYIALMVQRRTPVVQHKLDAAEQA